MAQDTNRQTGGKNNPGQDSESNRTGQQGNQGNRQGQQGDGMQDETRQGQGANRRTGRLAEWIAAERVAEREQRNAAKRKSAGRRFAIANEPVRTCKRARVDQRGPFSHLHTGAAGGIP